MCARLWSIIDKIEADDIVFDDLTVAICGDLVEGILRESSLTKLVFAGFSSPTSNNVVAFCFSAHLLLNLSTVF